MTCCELCGFESGLEIHSELPTRHVFAVVIRSEPLASCRQCFDEHEKEKSECSYGSFRILRRTEE